MKDRPPLIGALLLTFLPPLLSGCGIFGPDSQTSVRAELVRLPGESASAAVGAVRAPALAPPPTGITSDVTVSSLRIPITLVELRGPGGAGVGLYYCTPGGGVDCMVELNGPALESLLTTSEVDVSPGTYDEVAVGYCAATAASGWHALATAEARFGGVTYYSRSAAGLDDVGPAEPVALPYGGCGSGFPIHPPLEVAEETVQRVVLRLYFDIRDIAYAGSGTPERHGFGCSPIPSGSAAPYVCAAYPTVVALYDGLPPVVERYRINGGATLGLNFMASSGEFVEAYVRRYFTAGEVWDPGFTPDGFFSTFTSNGDGSFRMERSDVSFPSFRRETHSGTMIPSGGTGPIPYTALRLP